MVLILIQKKIYVGRVQAGAHRRGGTALHRGYGTWRRQPGECPWQAGRHTAPHGRAESRLCETGTEDTDS